MKLRNKLLTVLPMAIMGVLTPITISSCSCGTSLTIKYGDSINCKDEQDKTIAAYHNVDEIKNSAKGHVQNYTEGNKFDNLDWNDTTICEFFYWDLVYSLANKQQKFTLIWDIANKAIAYNGTRYSTLHHVKNAQNVWQIVADETIIIDSYAYSKHA